MLNACGTVEVPTTKVKLKKTGEDRNWQSFRIVRCAFVVMLRGTLRGIYCLNYVIFDVIFDIFLLCNDTWVPARPVYTGRPRTYGPYIRVVCTGLKSDKGIGLCVNNSIISVVTYQWDGQQV